MGNGEHTDLAGLAATVDRLAGALAGVQAENARLRQRVETLERPPTSSPTTGATRATAPAAPAAPAAMDRRRLLRDGLVAGAAATAAVVATAPPTAAANGSNLVLGDPNNNASAPTALTVTGTTASIGLGVTDNVYAGTLPDATVFAHSKDQAFTVALAAIAEGSGTAIRARSGSGVGVRVDEAFVGVSSVGSEVGVFGTGFYGMEASGTRTGLRTTSGRAHIAFGSNGRGAPTADAVDHDRGDLVATQAGELWACVADGTPGTWRKIASPLAAGALHVLPAPVRIYDSRPGTLPPQSPKTPLSSGVARSLDLKVNGSTVPAGATAALVTVLLVNAATANGNFTIWANGIAKPASNTMVWGGSAGRFTTTAVTALDSQARCQVIASHATDLVLDVVGYYR